MRNKEEHTGSLAPRLPNFSASEAQSPAAWCCFTRVLSSALATAFTFSFVMKIPLLSALASTLAIRL